MRFNSLQLFTLVLLDDGLRGLSENIPHILLHITYFTTYYMIESLAKLLDLYLNLVMHVS